MFSAVCLDILSQNIIMGANLALKRVAKGRMTHLSRLQMLQFSSRLKAEKGKRKAQSL